MCYERYYGPHVWAGYFSPKDIARMKHMAGHFMRHFMDGLGTWIPHNVEDLGEEYLITVPLPGRTKEDVQVSLINKNLNINAKKPKIPEMVNFEKQKKKEFPLPFHRFRFADVNMDIPLPVDADENSITSRMANGLLRVKIGKKPAKHININEGGNN